MIFISLFIPTLPLFHAHSPSLSADSLLQVVNLPLTLHHSFVFFLLFVCDIVIIVHIILKVSSDRTSNTVGREL